MSPLILMHLHFLCLNAEINDIRLVNEYRITPYFPVEMVSLSSNGARGIGLNEHYKIIMFDKHGYVNLTTKHGLSSSAVAMAPNGKELAIADGKGNLSILATDTLKPIAKKSFRNSIRGLHWLPSGKYIAATIDNEEIKPLIPWTDSKLGEPINDLKIPSFENLVYAPDRDAFLFSLEKGNRWAYVQAEEGTFRKSELNFDTPGVQFVTVRGLSSTGIMVTDEDNLSHWRSITSPNRRVPFRDAFDRRSAFLGVTSHYVELRSDSFRVTNTVTGYRTVQHLRHPDNPTTFCCSTDGSTIAVGFEDGWVHVYEIHVRFGPRELRTPWRPDVQIVPLPRLVPSK